MGVVVCVLDASILNIRTSKAISMVQAHARPELQACTIGVFAKSDKAVDPDWEEEDGATGALWKVRVDTAAPRA